MTIGSFLCHLLCSKVVAQAALGISTTSPFTGLEGHSPPPNPQLSFLLSSLSLPSLFLVPKGLANHLCHTTLSMKLDRFRKSGTLLLFSLLMGLRVI